MRLPQSVIDPLQDKSSILRDISYHLGDAALAYGDPAGLAWARTRDVRQFCDDSLSLNPLVQDDVGALNQAEISCDITSLRRTPP